MTKTRILLNVRAFLLLWAICLFFAAAVRAEDVPEGMVLVPAGPFSMGINGSETPGPNTPRERSDARPLHKVDVAAFYIDKTEVTNAQYKKYCDATHYPYPPQWTSKGFATGTAEVPVTFVNWWEAQAYARWAGKRLPTEAEWEKAARGTDERLYPWGNEWDKGRAVWGVEEPQAVGSKPDGASPYGALDMAGNVFEWTSDWYQAYPDAPYKFPEFGTQFKVIRGGGFRGFEFITQTFYRSVARRQTRSEWLGFRCARDVKVN